MAKKTKGNKVLVTLKCSECGTRNYYRFKNRQKSTNWTRVNTAQSAGNIPSTKNPSKVESAQLSQEESHGQGKVLEVPFRSEERS